MLDFKNFFKKYDIRHIVSVDDCHKGCDINQKKEFLKESITSDYKKFSTLIKADYPAVYQNIEDYSDVGIGDIRPFVDDLLIEMSSEQIDKYFNVINGDTVLNNEKVILTKFLNELVTEKTIAQYSTYDLVSKVDVNTIKSMINGNILWFIDRDFADSGESKDEGLRLAEKIIAQEDSRDFVFIVSGYGPNVDNEEDEEKEFDNFLRYQSTIENKSFIYYIPKTKFNSGNKGKILKGLATGFCRRNSYEIINMIINYIKKGLEESENQSKSIKQDTLNYLINKKVIKLGEASFDVIIRIIKLLLDHSINTIIADNFSSIANMIVRYEEDYEILGTKSNYNDARDELEKLRLIEMYDDTINQRFKEVEMGDIFQYNNEFYILISQSCDIALRAEGNRNLTYGNLLKICEENPQNKEYIVELSCFLNYKEPYVILQNSLSIPFDILDLCAQNKDGIAEIDKQMLNHPNSDIKPPISNNMKHRMQEIVQVLKVIIEKNEKVKSDIDTKCFISKKERKQILKGIDELNQYDSIYKSYKDMEGIIRFDIKRISQLNYLETIFIADRYSNAIDRIGLPFDFLKKS